jgi:hypothetical protein
MNEETANSSDLERKFASDWRNTRRNQLSTAFVLSLGERPAQK